MKTIIASFILLPLLLSSCSGEEGHTVRRKKLVQAVYASGEVLPVGFYEASGKAPGIVDSLYVTVGQQVDAGAPLLSIQSQSNQLNLQTAKNLYTLARDNASKQSGQLTSLRQQVETAYDAYQQDSIDVERYKRLRAQEISSLQAYEQAVLRYQNSRSNYIIARNTLRETRNRLQTELKNARNNYLEQQSRLADYTIVAATAGKVYDILPQQGELISSSTPVVSLGAADSFEVDMRVDETDIVLVQQGQTVLYELDALEQTVLRGQVRKIYPKIDPADKTARVTSTIDPMGYDLYLGMSLEANIIVQEKDSVLVIPVEYLGTDGTVRLSKEGKVETVKVTTGIRDLEYVEILSGLAENDQIMKP